MAIMRRQFKFQKQTVERRDKRVELLTELLQGIKLIKLLGWEQSMIDKLDKTREAELHSIKWKVYAEAGGAICWIMTPILVNIGKCWPPPVSSATQFRRDLPSYPLSGLPVYRHECHTALALLQARSPSMFCSGTSSPQRRLSQL
jgi:hypothetical protein